MSLQVDYSHYNDINYNDQGRFNSYWHQIDSAIRLSPRSVLEIGTGNGIVNFILEKSGIDVTTIDIDENLKPDIIGSVTDMPIKDNSYDLALCCQVLEHLPYENFYPSLCEIRRVVSKGLILSLPDFQRVYRFWLEVPLLGHIKFLYKIPRLKDIDWEFNGEHYWNISCKHFPLKRIKKDIEKAGFVINETFTVFELSWHRFFILEKA